MSTVLTYTVIPHTKTLKEEIEQNMKAYDSYE